MIKRKPFPFNSLSESIRHVAEGDVSAASVIALLNREVPDKTMECLVALEKSNTHGRAVYEMFINECGGDLKKFVSFLVK